MSAQRKKEKHRATAERGGRGSELALLPILLGVLCFTTAVAFDTNIHGTFDLSKLAFVYLAAMAVLVGAAWRVLSRAELRLPRTPLDGPVLATVLAAVLAAAFSVDWRCSVFGAYKTYEGVLQIVAYMVLLLAATRLRRREVVVVIGVILCAAFGAATYGIVQRLGHDPLGWSKNIAGREISTFGNPVFFGMFTAMFIPAAVGLALRDLRREESEQRAAWWWAGGAVVAGIFCSKLFPSLNAYRGADTLGSLPKAGALVAVSVLVCALLGRRLLLGAKGSGWSRGQRWWAVAMVVVLNIALYTSRTVGVLLAFIVALIWLTLQMAIADRDSFRRHRGLWLLLTAGLLVVNLGLNLWPATSTTGRISKLVFRASPSDDATGDGERTELAPSGSLYKRLLLYRSGINIIRAHPLLGVGPDAIERVIASHWAADWQLEQGHLVEVEGFENRLHNEALELLASQGIVGFAVRVWLYAAFLLMLWRGVKREDAGEQSVLAGLAASWVLMVVCNLFEYPTIPISAAFWVLTGLTVAWVQNHGPVRSWPTRTVRLPRRPPALLVSGLMIGVLAVVACFWVIALARPYRADRHFMQAQILLKTQQLERATTELRIAVRLAPELHVYRELLCSALASIAGSPHEQGAELQDRRGEEAARELVATAREAVRRSPWRGTGYAYLATGKETLADHLSSSSESTAAPQIRELRREATTHLQTAIKVNPHNVGLRTVYGRHCIRHRQWQEFLRLAEETLARWPEDRSMGDLVIHAASILVNTGQYEWAERVLLATKNRMPVALQDKLWEGLGRVYWALQRWHDLEGAGRTMITLAPEEGLGHRFLAVALAQQGRLDDAEAAARRLLELNPDDEYATVLLTKLLAMQSTTAAGPPAAGDG